VLCCLLCWCCAQCTAAATDEPPTNQEATGTSGRASLESPATPGGHALLRSRTTRSTGTAAKTPPSRPVASSSKAADAPAARDKLRRTSPQAAADPFLESQEPAPGSVNEPAAEPRITPRKPAAESGRSLTERLRIANRGGKTEFDRNAPPGTDAANAPAPEPPASAESAAENAPAEPSDPSMLSRLRGLYSPRIDENTERLRKQMLRLSDPFGLIHERDAAATEPAAATPELPMTAELQPDLTAPPQPTDLVNRDTALMATITLLEDELRNWPRNSAGRPENLPAWRRKQTDLRLLLMVSGRNAESIRTIEALPREEQEFWQSLMLAMNQYRTTDETIPRSDLIGETLRQIRTAEQRLQPLARLEISRLQFCSRINGFGNVVAFPTADFEPGQRLLLYVGLKNFRSELTGEGRYRTESAVVIDYIREEDGEALEPIRLPSIPDECDEQRTDYYHSIELTAPLLEGSWIVRVRVRDQYSMQVTEAQLKLNVR
jgi:hypothetical protein